MSGGARVERGGRALALAALVALAGATVVRADAPRLLVLARVSGGAIEAAPSFLDGGFGKLVDGTLPEDDGADALVAEGRLALDWEPAVGWRLFLHGVARADPSARESDSGSGVLEAYVERRFGFGAGQEIALRAGQFFLPASRENVEPLWTSPYTLTLSAMNSWIAEEIRPIGLDVSWAKTTARDHRFALAGTIFGGNDTSGTLIAWRGFALHDRPVPAGRWVPLPPLPELDTEFAAQSRRGTKPFGEDLDGRPGYAGRARWDAPGGRAVVQVTAFLNDADRRLHGDEYAWRTDFRWLSTELELAPGLLFVGEWGTGTSRMGIAPPGSRSSSRVDVLYDVLYGLLTWERGRVRLTARYDDFRVEDRDETPGDDNREDGSAWTAALLVRLGERWRLGAEWLRLAADRPAARAPGAPTLDGDSLRFELRWAF